MGGVFCLHCNAGVVAEKAGDDSVAGWNRRTESCPHIVGTDEGTQYCDMAAWAVFKKDNEIGKLKERVRELEAKVKP